jgi:small subunit ribosomal protein S6e
LAQFKLIISDRKGRTIAQELKDRTAQPLLGTKVGSIIDSSIVGVAGGNRSEARVRKLVRGNMVTEEIYQLNSMLIEGTLPEKQEAVESTGSGTEPANKKH